MNDTILSQKGNIEISYQEKTKTHILSIKSPLYQTNLLTDARTLLSKGVYRAVKLIVKHIQEIDLDFSVLEEQVEQEKKDNTEGAVNTKKLRLCIPPQKIQEWYPNDHRHRELKAAADWMLSAQLNCEKPDKSWGKRNLVQGIEYSPERGLIVDIGAEVAPLFNVKKNKNFTLLDFGASMSLESKAASFFYDKCCKWRNAGIFSYTPQELADAFEVACDANRIKTRFILLAEKEIAKLFALCKVDFYFESFMVRSKVGRGASIERFVFRVFRCYPGSTMDKTQRESQKREIKELLKKIVPSMYQEGIPNQLEDLDRYELFDLWKDMLLFRDKVYKNLIKDTRGYCWKLLSEKYSINPVGDVRIQKREFSTYPKYKKMAPPFIEIVREDVMKSNEQEFTQKKVESNDWYKYWTDTINYICDNMKDGDNYLNDYQKLGISSFFTTPGNIIPEYNGSILNIKFRKEIYKQIFIDPWASYICPLKGMLKDAIFVSFPNIEKLIYSIYEENRLEKKEIIYPAEPK